MMKKVVLKRIDEPYPDAINDASKAVVSFLMSHDVYMVPFCESITNVPLALVGNLKFMADLEKYCIKSFELKRYYVGPLYNERDVKILVNLLTSYFAFYDDVVFHDFIQRNSRYSIPKRETVEELQSKAFGRLKGFVFEQLVCELLSMVYIKGDCRFESGCTVEIEGEIVQVRHKFLSRKTIDFAGIDEGLQSGDFMECKVQPIRIDEITVKYIVHLYEKMKGAGYINVMSGFVTAGSQEAVLERVAEKLDELGMCNPEITVYDIETLRMLLPNEAV